MIDGSRIIDPVTVKEYIQFRESNFICLAKPSLEKYLRDVYRTGRWVYDWLKNDPSTERLRGRKPVLAGRLGETEVVVKRLHHGGLLEPITGDRFMTPGRFKKPPAVCKYLKDKGIPTPEILFSTYIRRVGFVRGETGMARLAPGIDAAAYLFPARSTPPEDAVTLATRIGGFVRRIHDAWFIHPDLNLMNIYLTNDGKLVLLDIDKAEVPRRPPSRDRRLRNLARLERSINKLGRRTPDDVSKRLIEALRKGYREDAPD